MPTKSMRNFICVHSIFSIIMINTFTHAAKSERNEHTDGFYSYVLKKGISIKQISENVYRISHKKWYCDIDTLIPKNFKKMNISWTDMFETRIKVLSEKTVFSPKQLRKKMGVLPKDGTPVTLVARQGNVSIPEENVIIRLNRHGPLDARTTMVMTWAHPVRTVTMSARNQPNQEIIHWIHYIPSKDIGQAKDNGLWNTSHPLVVPETVWDLENLTYYRGPLFFMKGRCFIGNFAKCTFKDFIGLGALNRLIHLKGTVTTLGFSTSADEYNTRSEKRVHYLAHKLAWSYYVVKELTDTSAQEFSNVTYSRRDEKFSDLFLKNIFLSGSIFIYSVVIVVMCILTFTIRYRKLTSKWLRCSNF